MTRLAVVALLLLAGCAEGPRLGETAAPMAVTTLAVLPPPTGADLAAAARPYRIGPLEKLEVKVFDFEDLSGTFQTDGAGRISMPLVGEIDASGRTPDELAGEIGARLGKEFLRGPHVTVNLGDVTSQTFTVDGQVGQPGSYPIAGNMTLMRAVANAKGLAEFARLDDVVVFRTSGGKTLAALYNLGAIRHGLYSDPDIYANDVIIVGDSSARRRFQQFLQVAPLLSTPLILALERLP
jgi:polysaccharide export outer membrane protein